MDNKWSAKKSDLNISNRLEGISGFLRVRNEEEWLSLVIESHMPFLDEIVIVYNRCTDSTPEIAQDYAKRYPDKIKAIHFEPDVYPQGSKEAISLPINNPHSLANYYNYALCQTTRKVALKVDGDQIAIPFAYKQMISFVKKYKNFPYYYKFKGINLYKKNNKVMVQGYKNFTGMDRGFFEINKKTFPWHNMDRKRGLEILNFKNISSKSSKFIGFFHTKGLKRDKGSGNYDLDFNPSSRYHSIFSKEWLKSKPITWESFIKNKKNNLQYIPHPNNLKIK